MILLNQIQIASPCHASWDDMEGDEQIRFCGQCRKNVYNLSEMTRRDAQTLLAQTGVPPCVRFYKRADGTLLTRDCPVGKRLLRKRRASRFALAVSVPLALLTQAVRADPPPPARPPASVTMGAPPAPPMLGEMAAPPSRTMGRVVLVMGKPIAPPPHRKPNLPPKKAKKKSGSEPRR